MSTTDRWEKLKLMFIDSSEKDYSSYVSIKNKFIIEYKNEGYIKLTPKQALEIPLEAFILFYFDLLENQLIDSIIPSPIAKEANSNWMLSKEFSFINVRACGRKPQILGNFIECIKLLPTIRSSAIHLAPFFQCAFGNIYSINSSTQINDEVVNQPALLKGLSRYEQLQIFVDCSHLINKVIGFDLEPHTSQFSKVVLDNPKCFRWIRLSPDKETLFDNMKQDDMIREEHQHKIVEEIKAIVNKHLEIMQINCIECDEDSEGDLIKSNQVFGNIISELIEKGYWTIPNHTWNGVGIPEFSKYIFSGNYPEFKYLDKTGKDQSSHAFGMLTPFKFYTNLQVNNIPKDYSEIELFPTSIKVFSDIFMKMYAKTQFDFVRFDYVDHVFDSVANDDWRLPISDRITPEILDKTIKIIKKDNPHIGITGERMGEDIELYEAINFNLILGEEIITALDEKYYEKFFLLQNQILNKNESSSNLSSIQLAIDTHDSGHPIFGGKTPSQLYGSSGMLMRQFFADFSSWGLYKRPKYEVFGNHDMTHGIYIANNTPESLNWFNDLEHFRLYNNLEDIYKFFKSILIDPIIMLHNISSNYIYWIVYSQKTNEYIICYLCYKEKINEDLLNIEVFFDIDNLMLSEKFRYYNVKIDDKSINEIFPNEDNKIMIGTIKPYSIQLSWIKND